MIKKSMVLAIVFAIVMSSSLMVAQMPYSYATGDEGVEQTQPTDITVTADVSWEGINEGETLPEVYLGLFRTEGDNDPEAVVFDGSNESNPKAINGQDSVSWTITPAEGDPEYIYSVEVVDSNLNIVTPDDFTSEVTSGDDNTYSVVLTKKSEQQRFLSCIKPQTPEAGDTYVSVFVDLPSNLPNPGLNEVTDEYVKENLAVTVIIDEEEYATAYAIDDRTGKQNGYRFVYTIDPKEKKCPKLSEGKEISFRYKLGDADRTDVTTVGKAFVNAKYSRKALKNIVVTPKTKVYMYNGNYNKPAVTVKAKYSNGKDVPAAALSYTVSYEKSKNVGTATVTVTMVGDYSGKGTATYRINPRGSSVKKLAPLKKGFKITWAKQAKKMSTFYITGYQVQYATNNKFTKNAKTITVGTKENKDYNLVSKSVTKLAAKKKYYVRVRTYKKLNGVKYYSHWSATKTVTTK